MSGTTSGPATFETPDLLRELRTPWMSAGVSLLVQEHIRFASTMSERNGRAYTVRFASGGQGTIVEEPVKAEVAGQLKVLMESEYLGGRYVVEEDVAGLRSFLAGRGVELVLSSSRIASEVVDITGAVCRALPEAHLGHDFFRVLELGGWGHGSAKASEHDGSKVHLFTFATKGPRRNFAALLLHEIGHAHFDWLNAARPDVAGAMRSAQKKIRALTGGDLGAPALMPFAIDYLLGPESRVQECIIDLREFAAESYLLYVVRGRALVAAMSAMPREIGEPWLAMYEAMKRGFDGIEYV